MRRILVVSSTYVDPANRGKLRALAARRLKIPTVLFTRQNVTPTDGLFAAWRRSRTLRRLRGAIAGSTAAADLVREIAPDLPVTVLPQLGVAVPPVPEHALHEGLAIGYVGRLVPEKGVDTLLEALAEIRGDRWHLSVVGDGPARERLEALASEPGPPARGRRGRARPPERIERLWQDLDVLVVPSRRYGTWAEAALHVVAEAMAHEVAVIGTDGGVTPEIIGDAGVIVPPGEASALAAALRRLATPAARQPLVQAARARAMQLFSEDAVAERTLDFWRSVLW